MAALSKLKLRQPLRCVREPNNRYDRYAVAIYLFDLHIGYLSRGVAKDMAALIDSGMTINVRNARAGTGLVELQWSDDDLQSPASGGWEDGFDTFEAPREPTLTELLTQSVAELPRDRNRQSRLVPPKPPRVKPPTPPKPKHFFPELDLPPEEPDTRPDPWE